MGIEINLILLVLVWVATALLILYLLWKRKLQGTGLILAYLMNLGLIHWLGAVIYLFPWYQNLDLNVVEAGFVQATYGVVAFAVGVLFLAPIVMRMFQFPPSVGAARKPNPRLPKAYIAVGLVSYFVLMPILGRLPTLTALISASWNLVVVGFSLACWKAWHQRRNFMRWLFAAMSLPFITIVFQGFLGYGAVAFIIVFAFLIRFARPRWKIVFGSLILFYLGISFYVTYMRDRPEIREVVWGKAPLTARVAQLYETISHPEWFNPYNNEHLWRIDIRLNQNFFVGVSVYYLDQGYRDYAHGETIWQALIALVPRALWPSKPIYAGGGNLVSEYTGIQFAQGTSVGVGQVMEFYINFGTTGVIFGFLLIGVIVAALDKAASERLQRGDWQGFALWFLPGIAFLNVGGSLVEVTSSAGAAVVAAHLINKYLLPHMRGRRVHSISGVRESLFVEKP